MGPSLLSSRPPTLPPGMLLQVHTLWGYKGNVAKCGAIVDLRLASRTLKKGGNDL